MLRAPLLFLIAFAAVAAITVTVSSAAAAITKLLVAPADEPAVTYGVENLGLRGYRETPGQAVLVLQLGDWKDLDQYDGTSVREVTVPAGIEQAACARQNMLVASTSTVDMYDGAGTMPGQIRVNCKPADSEQEQALLRAVKRSSTSRQLSAALDR